MVSEWKMSQWSTTERRFKNKNWRAKTTKTLFDWCFKRVCVSKKAGKVWTRNNGDGGGSPPFGLEKSVSFFGGPACSPVPNNRVSIAKTSTTVVGVHQI